ncbi:MAG: flagellar basal body L-ring protein FlgH [Bryobacteraceae bacterium]|nr:flagellar basal body L-ring protein FlgH [Bryobacteraceae bacterium]
MRRISVLLLACAALSPAKTKKAPPLTPLEEYVRAAREMAGESAVSPGSLYSPGGRFGDLARDLRAFQKGDLITIVVSDRASAVSRGSTSASRTSNLRASIPALAGPRTKIPALGELAEMESESSLEGDGSTTRSNTLTTTLTARVVETLPNGYLVIEGTKDVQANSERQRVSIRGVVRWNDLSPTNRIASDRVGQMQIAIEGKGVVGDAIRRPNFLYRLLMGVLPF